MNLDRFQPPTASDEFYHCENCGVRRHHEHLDEDGLCAECRPEPPEEQS